MLRVAVTLLCLWATTCAQPRKNVVIFLGDDAGLELSVYNNKAIQMPNLDSLAAKSLVFNKAYTSVSSGAPSRAALLTGTPQHQNGMYGMAGGASHFSSFDDVISLPAILSGHGVRTGLVGKKQVKPDAVYTFDFEATERQFNINQIGRNITLIRQKVQQFLASHDPKPFLLLISFHDPHRCQLELVSQYGEFCERLGNGVGVIPDWKPVNYHPDNVTVPYYLPDTKATRQDLADMYTAYSRMDQGIGAVMAELQSANALDNTLVLYTSDNAIPFPNAKTNLYEPGMTTPLLVSDPTHKQNWGRHTEAIVSTTDLMPTVLDWMGVTYNNPNVTLTGKTLLPLMANPNATLTFDHAFASHNMHEVTSDYPMRAVRTKQYRLIHNLHYHSPYPNTQDILTCPTMQYIISQTTHNQATNWFKPLTSYYHRERYELYDLDLDPYEVDNVATDPAHTVTLKSLQQQLMTWQEVTKDPWRCMPGGVLLFNGTCVATENGELMN